MYNLKRGGGTFKGLIGECMFKLTRKNLILTRFFNKNKYLNIFGDRLTEEQYTFLDNNWYSLDAIEVDYSIKPYKFVIFEVKTINYLYNPKSYWKLLMTENTYELYRKALKLNFDVKVATIILFDNWNYEVDIIDFDQADFSISKPKKYDI